MALLSARCLWERLRDRQCQLSDGGIGSELILRGVAPEDTTKANLCLSDTVQDIHEAYIRAGADIITCNTFSAAAGNHWETEIRAGIELATQCALAASHDIGIWITFPAIVITQLHSALRRIIVDAPEPHRLLLIETCTTLEAASAATKCAQGLKPGLLAVTGHFRTNGRMPDGTTPEQFASRILADGAQIVGANCGESPEQFIEITVRMRSVTETPLLMQPSAGLPAVVDTDELRYTVEPTRFAKVAYQLFDAGAMIVGGCCGTSPAHIAAVPRGYMRTACLNNSDDGIWEF